MINSLINKKILIVGGSSGIGLAVARQAHILGANVIIASRSASERHHELVSLIGDEIETLSYNIASESETRCIVEQVGKIDHLVLTVRPDLKPDRFQETDISAAKEAFETKFWGQYRLIQQVWRKINQNGSITMTAGIAGEHIYQGFSTMSMINSAAETLCRALAVELSPIRVNIVSPGFVEPKAKEIEKQAEQFPLGRLASPEDIAHTYIYLMTNSYTTGTAIVTDGGARLI